MRSWCATLMLGRGVSLKVVSETLGHSQIAVTAHTYMHVTPSMRHEDEGAGGRSEARLADREGDRAVEHEKRFVALRMLVRRRHLAARRQLALYQ